MNIRPVHIVLTVIVCSLLVFGIFIYVPRVLRGKAVQVELIVREYGRVLYLFVSDQKRMPVNHGELLSRGYLERNADGRTSPGVHSRDRRSPIAPLYWDNIRFPSDLNEYIGVAWGRKQAGQFIWVNKSSPGGEKLARRYSILLGKLLNGEEINTTAPVVPTENTIRP